MILMGPFQSSLFYDSMTEAQHIDFSCFFVFLYSPFLQNQYPYLQLVGLYNILLLFVQCLV